MGWYDRNIVPRIIKLGCGCRMMAEHRQKIVPQARGRVLELGMGAGANLAFYDAGQVCEVVGIEPSAELRAMAEKAVRPEGLRVRIEDGVAEALPFGAGEFDTVVCTFTLCSVRDPAKTLAEAQRVLKTGGVLLFHEHGRSPDPAVAKWQRRIEPIWTRLFGGCHLTRAVGASIGEYFSLEEADHFYGRGPRIASWMEAGRAVVA